MKKVWSLQFAQERDREVMGDSYQYSWEKDVNMIATKSGLVPFVDSGSKALELMTKTEQSFESDDDEKMISFEVTHVA